MYECVKGSMRKKMYGLGEKDWQVFGNGDSVKYCVVN